MATFPMGGGQGLWSCPAGSGLLPSLHGKAAAATLAAGGGAAGAGAGGVGACVVPAALGSPGPGLAGAGKSVAAGGLAKGAIVGGGACKGLSLGLGIGLGLWGPTILAGLGVAAAYSLWRSRAAIDALSEDEAEMGEALSGR